MIPAREYLHLEIAPNSEEELDKLEARMQTSLASEVLGEPWWFTTSTPNGGSIRIYGFRRSDRVEFSGLLGDLGTPTIRLKLGPADATLFRPAGPGAASKVRDRPPMILPHVIDALYRATGRRRLR